MFPFSSWGNDNGAPTFNNGPSSASGQQAIVGSSLPPPAARVTRNTATNAQTNGARIATVDANQGYFTRVYNAFKGLYTPVIEPPLDNSSRGKGTGNDFFSTANMNGAAFKRHVKKPLTDFVLKLLLIIVVVFAGYIFIKTAATKAATKLA